MVRRNRAGHTVWRLAASDGERAAKGDLLADLVDCRTAFLYVAIPQNRVPDVVWGGKVRYRLSGETGERTGQVDFVSRETTETLDQHFAAAPALDPDAPARVRVRIDNREGSCIVGRTAQVLLPASRGAMLLLADRLF